MHGERGNRRDCGLQVSGGWPDRHHVIDAAVDGCGQLQPPLLIRGVFPGLAPGPEQRYPGGRSGTPRIMTVIRGALRTGAKTPGARREPGAPRERGRAGNRPATRSSHRRPVTPRSGALLTQPPARPRRPGRRRTDRTDHHWPRHRLRCHHRGVGVREELDGRVQLSPRRPGVAVHHPGRVLPEGGPHQVRVCEGHQPQVQVLGVQQRPMALEAPLTPATVIQPRPPNDQVRPDYRVHARQ
ncbi:hypothetical protein J2853_009577 [Streptosporangium lutulentum]|uniref:Uncharacterized protein n=1 Tax=Streptosporangium lutulentum TaxID=1461250 RepID=A0ABT9QV48_9ACTN|nr:hypothetical protein [Streptosporangium lutulentum]